MYAVSIILVEIADKKEIRSAQVNFCSDLDHNSTILSTDCETEILFLWTQGVISYLQLRTFPFHSMYA